MIDTRTPTLDITTTSTNTYTLFGKSSGQGLRRTYLKSPFNYIGNKHRLLGQILPLFPRRIETFYDLFCGGLDVTINTVASRYVANDINYFVIEIFEYFKEHRSSKVIQDIYNIINLHQLSKEDKEAFYRFRDYYNEHKHPLLLFVLVCFSFNYQFRFNAKHDYNNTAGTHRSSFNESIEQRVVLLTRKLQEVELLAKNFKDLDYTLIKPGDFVYADPPYRASVGSYNDGKRGFEGWSLEDDLALFRVLDDLNKRGIKFAMSNVFQNNGHLNRELMEWSTQYHVHNLSVDYSNSNYQKKNQGDSHEVLITNY